MTAAPIRTFAALRARATAFVDTTLEEAVYRGKAWKAVSGGWRMVTPLGRTVAVIGVISWIAGWRLGWREMMILAGACLLLLVLGCLFIVGRATLRIEVRLEPSRVVAGEPSAGQVTVRNASSRRSMPLRVELPVGEGVALFSIPSLPAGAAAEEVFVVPTERRGLIPVGPATSVRGDPLGLFHRDAASSPAYELIVHPHTVPLDTFGSGLLRDLEGLTTRDLSVSDLAFHALREYTPGDDHRYVHWRSSAKAGRLLVRQFQDTRRSTLCVIVDGQTSGYGDSAEFETALEAAGSVVLRACRDEISATLSAGGSAATGSVPHVLLDTLSRAELRPDSADMATQVGRSRILGADASFGILLTGSTRSVGDLQRAAARFPVEVRVVAVRVVPGETPAIRSGGRATVVHLPALADLPAIMRSELAP